jgi:hypothetical protein
MLLLLTHVVFFQEIHVILQLSWIGLLATNRAFSTMKILIWRKYLFQKLALFQQGNNVLDTSDSNTHGFLSRDTFASSSYLNKPVWKKKECFSTLKTLICRMYSIQKLTQISHVNNVLCAPASDTDIFLCRDTCVSSSYLKRPILNKMPLCPPLKLWFAWSIPFNS